MFDQQTDPPDHPLHHPFIVSYSLHPFSIFASREVEPCPDLASALTLLNLLFSERQFYVLVTRGDETLCSATPDGMIIDGAINFLDAKMEELEVRMEMLIEQKKMYE